MWESRKNAFDFLRLVLSVCVILSHSWPLTLGIDAPDPLERWTHGQVTLGDLAVDAFFIMSGFLITASALRSKSLFDYLKRRVSRIYPAFIVVNVVALFVVVPLSGAHTYASLGSRLFHVIDAGATLRPLHLLNAFAGNPVPGVWNGSLWTVQFEFFCYIGIALFLVLGILSRRSIVLCLFALSVVASNLWIHHTGLVSTAHAHSVDKWFRLVPFYLAGTAFYLYKDRIKRSAAFFAVAVLGLLASAFVPFGLTLSLPLCGTYFILYLAFEERLHVSSIGKYGDFSYGAYLYAFPVQQLVVALLPSARSPIALFCIATPITMGIAMISWYAVERPFLRTARKRASAVEEAIHTMEKTHHGVAASKSHLS